MTGPIETEVKIAVPAGAAEARRRIEENGYKIVSPRTLESDQVFDRADQELRRTGQLLRLRSAGGDWLLTYKGPAVKSAGPYKSREEIETSLASSAESGPALFRILEKLGYVPAWKYEKYRTGFRTTDDRGTVFLDETPMGVFLELEGAEDWIDSTARHLGFSKSDYVTLSYASLYRSFLQVHEGPPDMIFRQP